MRFFFFHILNLVLHIYIKHFIHYSFFLVHHSLSNTFFSFRIIDIKTYIFQSSLPFGAAVTHLSLFIQIFKFGEEITFKDIQATIEETCNYPVINWMAEMVFSKFGFEIFDRIRGRENDTNPNPPRYLKVPPFFNSTDECYSFHFQFFVFGHP